MDKMNKLNYETFEEALILWTGWGKEAYPVRDEVRLIDHYGKEKAMDLLAQIKLIISQFYMTDAGYESNSLPEMAERAATQFQDKFPEFPETIIKIFVWCYTFDYK